MNHIDLQEHGRISNNIWKTGLPRHITMHLDASSAQQKSNNIDRTKRIIPSKQLPIVTNLQATPNPQLLNPGNYDLHTTHLHSLMTSRRLTRVSIALQTGHAEVHITFSVGGRHDCISKATDCHAGSFISRRMCFKNRTCRSSVPEGVLRTRQTPIRGSKIFL